MTNIPFPNKDTNLFKIEQEGYNIADIEDLSFDAYATGYLSACKLILEEMDRNSMFVSDSYVYPICYLFRHFLELKLKHIILIGEKQGTAKYDITHYKHNIVMLWNDAANVIKTYPSLSPDSDLAIVGKNICELQQKFADDKGMVFRYPVDKKGNKSFKKRVHIDLKQFKKSMEEIANFLEGCSEGMIEEKNLQKEIEAEYRNEAF